MSKYYYKKDSKVGYKTFIKAISILLSLSGLILLLYTMFPLISWQIYFAPIFHTQDIQIPIPKTTVVAKNDLSTLVVNASEAVFGADYTNAKNWFPSFETKKSNKETLFYTLSIPKLGINNATVSTNDYDLSKHLINYPGTEIPPNNGNAVIFGHSTLPQLFNTADYKTIFATLYKIEVGDEVFTVIQNVSYKYRVTGIIVVDADDTSLLTQQYDDSYLTLVTCTPPGTTWKRLVVKTRLEEI